MSLEEAMIFNDWQFPGYGPHIWDWSVCVCVCALFADFCLSRMANDARFDIYFLTRVASMQVRLLSDTVQLARVSTRVPQVLQLRLPHWGGPRSVLLSGATRRFHITY